MRRLLCLANLWVLLLGAAACQAPARFPDEFEAKFIGRFAVSQNAFFGPLEPAARRLVAAEQRQSMPNHFCAIGYELDGGGSSVWVHWTEARRLLLWRGSSDPVQREEGLIQARRDLELGQDTVEQNQEIAGSSYRVTRAWWEAVVSDCESHGERLTLDAS